MKSKTTIMNLVKNLVARIDVREAWQQLGRTGSAGVDVVLDALQGKHGNAPKGRHPRDVHDDLMGALHAIGKVDVQPLIDALERRPEHAMSLVWVLGNSRDRAVVATLVECAKHRDLWVRWAAVEGMGRRRGKSLLPVLLEALADRSDMVRFSALVALAKISDPRTIEPLRRYLARKRLAPGAERIASELLAKLETSNG